MQQFRVLPLISAMLATLALSACSSSTQHSSSRSEPQRLAEPAAPSELQESDDGRSREAFAAGSHDASPGTKRQSPVPAMAVGAARLAADLSVGSEPYPAPAPIQDQHRERYAELQPNPVMAVIEQPVSTFSVDVDTGAYSNVRRILNQGQLPPADAVRVEEFINYFDYDYPRPADHGTPFAVHSELAVAPWNAERWVLQIGLQGYELATDELPGSNLVFLLDVSGSMNSADKLPLVKSAMRMVVEQMREHDRVAIVVYAGAAGLVLPPTSGREQARIMAALDSLQAGGSTNGGQGIELAYRVAREQFIEGGVNRVILATDGDFNVGMVNQRALEDLVSRERKSGIALTTLGFGRGNYNDHLAERLANLGNGNHAYIDSEREAHKVLVRELSSTLMTIAQDVKIQIEFSPAVVAEYRLIGYENRLLAREDFANDAVDAGEIGAGHTVTALYELTPVDSGARRLPPLRYAAAQPPAGTSNELAMLKLRYKNPGEQQSVLIERPIARPGTLGSGSDRLQLSAAVAAFGEALRGGKYLDGYGYADIAQLAASSELRDPYGLQSEFQQLILLAARLSGEHGQEAPIAISR